MTVRSSSARRGVSRVEALLACGALVLLAGVVSPAIGGRSPAQQAAAIEDLTCSLRQAAYTHFLDTGKPAIEYSAHPAAASAYHQLSTSTGLPGWKGPYLQAPLASLQNPCGGEVFVYANLQGGAADPGGGFDLDGVGRDTVRLRGQFVAFTGVDASVARRVDQDLDRGRQTEDWRNSGCVEFDGNGTLMVFLYAW